MKTTKRILIIAAALLLTVSVFGCTKPKENDPSASAAPDAAPVTSAPTDTSAFDRDAIAVELGDIRITAGEISDFYDDYMSWYESYLGSVPTDDASIKEYRDLAVNETIRYHVPEWKAAELGVALSDEQIATIEAIAGQENEELKNSLILDYAMYYGGVEDVEDVSELDEKQISDALDKINEELSVYFYEGYTLDQWLEEQYRQSIADRRMELLKDNLRVASIGASEVTDEQIENWYNETLLNQQTSFADDPLSFRDQLTDYQNGTSSVPVLYQPEGFVKVQVIRIAPEAERDLLIDTNRAEMAKLEAEYGALALNGQDEKRQAEIKEAYDARKAENETLEEQYLGDARKAINAAYEALEEETPFEEVLASINPEAADSELMLYIGGEDPDYAALAKAAQDILVNTYSEPLLIDDVFYIIKRVETPASGALNRDAIEDDIRTAATDALTGSAWTALYEEWETEANQAAVRHEDAYAAIGYLNQ